MPPRVPQISPQIAPAGQPAARIGLQVSPEQFGAGLARGLAAGADVATQIAVRERGKADLTNLDRASNFRMDRKREIRDRWLSKKMERAMEQDQELQEEIRTVASESAQFFPEKDVRTRSANKIYSDRWVTDTLRELSDYTRGQSDRFRTNQKQANLKNHLDDVALLSSDPRVVSDKIQFMNTFLANHGQLDGKSTAQVESEITEMTRASYRAAIENRLAVEDWEGAKSYIEGKGIGTLIPPVLMAKYEEMIENGQQVQSARDEVDVRIGEISEAGDPLSLDHGGFSVDNEILMRNEIRDAHKDDPDLANEMIRQAAPFFIEQRAAADSRKAKFIEDAAEQMADGISVNTVAATAPAAVRNILRQYGANRTSGKVAKTGRHARSAETLTSVRRLIDNGLRGLPKGDGPVPESITSMGELIPLIAPLDKNDQDQAIKYLNDRGFLGVDLHTMITKSAKTFFKNKTVSPTRLAALYDEVSARLPSGQVPKQGDVDNLVHFLAVRGEILLPGGTRRKAIGLDAAQRGEAELFLPGSPTGERDLSDAETQRIRLLMIANNLNPDPPGEIEPTDAERNFKRQLLGFPALGVAETNRQNFLTKSAAEQIQQSFKAEQAESRLREFVGRNGFSAMARDVLNEAELGDEPVWMLEVLNIANRRDQYEAGKANIENDPDASPDDVENYIRQQGLLMLQGVRP